MAVFLSLDNGHNVPWGHTEHGTPGPVIGPLGSVRVVWLTHIQLVADSGETLDLPLAGDMIGFGPKFYGTWAVVDGAQARKVSRDRRTSFEHAKAVLGTAYNADDRE